MIMQQNCFGCAALFTPIPGDLQIHCPKCAVTQREALTAALDYRHKIDSGDINVLPQNTNDARTVRRMIARRVASPPDCKPLRKSK